jgi:hypothetical protein
MTWVFDPSRTVRIFDAEAGTSEPARFCRIDDSPKTLPKSLPKDSPGPLPLGDGPALSEDFDDMAPMVLVRSNELIAQPLPHKWMCQKTSNCYATSSQMADQPMAYQLLREKDFGEVPSLTY